MINGRLVWNPLKIFRLLISQGKGRCKEKISQLVKDDERLLRMRTSATGGLLLHFAASPLHHVVFCLPKVKCKSTLDDSR